MLLLDQHNLRTALRSSVRVSPTTTPSLSSQTRPGRICICFPCPSKEDLGRHENSTDSRMAYQDGPYAPTCRYPGVLSQAGPLCQHLWLAVLRDWLAFQAHMVTLWLLIRQTGIPIHQPLVLEKIICISQTDIFILIIIYIFSCGWEENI